MAAAMAAEQRLAVAVAVRAAMPEAVALVAVLMALQRQDRAAAVQAVKPETQAQTCHPERVAALAFLVKALVVLLAALQTLVQAAAEALAERLAQAAQSTSPPAHPVAHMAAQAAVRQIKHRQLVAATGPVAPFVSFGEQIERSHQPTRGIFDHGLSQVVWPFDFNRCTNHCNGLGRPASGHGG
jgi:hypothetical protein